MGMLKCKKCGGMVVEADYPLRLSKKTVELECLNCGNNFEFPMKRYLMVLDAVGVDYRRRAEL